MIKSIKFNVKKGYISEEDKLIKNFKNRTFKFDRFKVNIIFGPNGSGKTTILRALSAYTFTGDPAHGIMDNRTTSSDGWTNLGKVSPMNSGLFMKDKEPGEEDILHYITSASGGNEAEIVWDGSPVYYHNFDERRDMSKGSGGLESMIGGYGIENIADAFYAKDFDQTHSAGEKIQNSLGAALMALDNGFTFEELMDTVEERMDGHNDLWKKYVTAVAEHIKSIREKVLPTLTKAESTPGNTVLFDEIDQNCDIHVTMVILFNLLREQVVKNKCQVILVCHNPIVLCDQIYKGHDFNVIEMDPEYTKKVRSWLCQLKYTPDENEPKESKEMKPEEETPTKETETPTEERKTRFKKRKYTK